MKPVHILLAIISLYLLSACSYSSLKLPDIGDGGLLSGEPCSAPCFWNITPGTTTEKQAVDILSHEFPIIFCEHWEKDVSGRDKGMRCGNIGITFNNDIVNGVSFMPSSKITVEEVIEKYGDPNGIGIGILGIEMTPPLMMNLYFDQEGMKVSLPEQDNTSYKILPDTTVETISYFEQSRYIFSIRFTQEWNGYRDYP
jgi:hypothetical protein